MIRRSPVVNINSNLRHTPMRISEFLSELSIMDDDSEKIMKLNDFICSLEDELNRIFRFQQQFPFSVLFLKEGSLSPPVKHVLLIPIGRSKELLIGYLKEIFVCYLRDLIIKVNTCLIHKFVNRHNHLSSPLGICGYSD